MTAGQANRGVKVAAPYKLQFDELALELIIENVKLKISVFPSEMI